MRDLIKEFIDTKAVEGGASLNTIKAYMTDINQYMEMIDPVLPENVKKEDIDAFLKKLKEMDNSPKTLARKISCVREFYKFLQSENIIENNPTSQLRTPKIGKPLPSFLTKKDIFFYAYESYNKTDGFIGIARV